MDIFGDKTYKDLDWITKATEPIVYSLNEKLMSLPEKFVMQFEDFRALCMTEYNIRYLSINECTNHFYNKHNITLSSDEAIELNNIYSFKIEGEKTVNRNGDPIELAPRINFADGTITNGTISLVKTKNTFSEDELKQKMGKLGAHYLKDIPLDNNKEIQDRLNEILDLLGCVDGMKKRSLSGKRQALINEYRNVMKNNTWNIRDVDLSNKVASWIRSYVIHGNLAAMANFCKLKAITHRGYPIYHIEEEQ